MASLYCNCARHRLQCSDPCSGLPLLFDDLSGFSFHSSALQECYLLWRFSNGGPLILYGMLPPATSLPR